MAKLITKDQLDSLPYWALVAYAVRCARRVAPLLEKFTEQPEDGDVARIFGWIELAEQRASRGRRGHQSNKTDPAELSDLISAKVREGSEKGFQSLADCVLFASLLSEGPSVLEEDETSPQLCAVSVNAAADAISALGDRGISRTARALIRADLDHLIEASEKNKWNENSPVAPDVFGRMWPKGVPNNWPEIEDEAEVEATDADAELEDANKNAAPCPDCGESRLVLRVKKEGPNQGRIFLKCTNKSCDNFEWYSASGESTSGGSQSEQDTELAELRDEIRDVPCPGCEETDGRQAFRVKKAGKNQGRLFVKCRHCEHFQWITSAETESASKPLEVPEGFYHPGPAGTKQDLELAILANPNDLGAHAAYADYLTEQGDPQGEFISVQLALQDDKLKSPERKKLQNREKALLKKHRKKWVGGWEDEMDPVPGLPKAEAGLFVNGILAGISVRGMGLECARSLTAAEETRLVRNLRMVYLPDEDDYDQVEYDEKTNKPFGPTEALLQWPGLRNVRLFQCGEPEEEEYDEWCPWNESAYCGKQIYQLVQKMPNLEELYLFAQDVNEGRNLFALSLPRLRILQHYHDYRYPISSLAKNQSLTNLTHVLFHPHPPDAEEFEDGAKPAIRLAGLRAILKSDYLKNLTHLRLRCSDLGDAGCKAIVDSGILKQLKLLDLRHGCITDKGAKTLLDCNDLKNLEHLDLQGNQIGEVEAERLEESGISVNVSYQLDADDNSWLFNGAFE